MTMSDLISRQAALDTLKGFNVIDIISYEHGVIYVQAVINAIYDRLNKLPSAESERIAKVIEHDASVTDTDGYKYHRSEYLCGACKKRVIGGDEYCSHCGARLKWNHE